MAADGITAWYLNLDAERELAAPRGYAPSSRVRALVRAHRSRALGLLGPGDVLVDEETPLPAGLRGAPGRAFCPTPWALRVLRGAGAVPVPSPPLEVLRRVNHRGFSAGLGPTLPGEVFAAAAEDAESAIAAFAPGTRLLLKRAFGGAGRGRRRVSAGAATPEDVAWIRASCRGGGLAVEPLVEVVREMAVHGWVAAGGEARVGGPRLQECDAHGQWLRSRDLAPGELTSGHLEALAAEGARVAAALGRAGYFGPFAIDAFLYRAPDGEVHLRARSEINARFSMGFVRAALGPPPI